MNFIKKIINSREEKKAAAHQRFIEIMKLRIAIATSISEMYIASTQSKCFTCKHKYEKKDTFATGGIVASINTPEKILSKDEQVEVQEKYGINKLAMKSHFNAKKEK